jgi:hypothetical protein
MFESLKGKTLINVMGLERWSWEVFFEDSDNNVYIMYHSFDCCESVSLEDFEGNVKDLIGHEILLAEESTKDDESGGGLWTFYKLATIKGYLDLRWYGTSNGYYSIDVSFRKCYDYEEAKYRCLIKKQVDKEIMDLLS